MKSFIIWSEMNNMGFGVRVKEEDYEKAKELAYKGFSMWNDPLEYPEFEQLGYAEPSCMLLDEAGIEHEIIHVDEDADEWPDWCDGVYYLE